MAHPQLEVTVRNGVVSLNIWHEENGTQIGHSVIVRSQDARKLDSAFTTAFTVAQTAAAECRIPVC